MIINRTSFGAAGVLMALLGLLPGCAGRSGPDQPRGSVSGMAGPVHDTKPVEAKAPAPKAHPSLRSYSKEDRAKFLEGLHEVMAEAYRCAGEEPHGTNWVVHHTVWASPAGGPPEGIDLSRPEKGSPSPEELACVEAALAQLRFPPSKGEEPISIEFKTLGRRKPPVTEEVRKALLAPPTPECAPAAPGVPRCGLDKVVITRIMKLHANEITYCYQASLNYDPDLAGSTKIVFIIGPSGHVIQAGAKETEGIGPAVEECLVRTILRFQFPPPKGGGKVTVTYPYTFRPASKK